MYLVITSNNVINLASQAPIDEEQAKENGEYIIEISDHEFKNDMINAIYHGANKESIEYTPKPIDEHDTGAVSFFEADNGEWVDVRSEEEIWEKLNIERKSLLQRSDWTVLPDSPLSTKQLDEAKTWRQEIRDLPQNTPHANTAREKLYQLKHNKPSFI